MSILVTNDNQEMPAGCQRRPGALGDTSGRLPVPRGVDSVVASRDAVAVLDAVEIAYDHAKTNLAGQRARLDNLRTRAAAIITSGSVVASFLGAQALADTKPGANGSPVADRSLQFWEIVAVLAFIALLAACAWIISPKNQGWTFRLRADKLLTDYADKGKDATTTQRDLAKHMENYYGTNEPKIERLFSLLQAAIAALAIEAMAFILDLTT